MKSFIIKSSDLASIRLDGSALERTPPRPKAQQQPGYADTFDFHTLFYDAFRLADGRVRFMGPPPFNLAEALDAAHLTLGDIEGAVGAQASGINRRNGQRVFALDVLAPQYADRLSLEIARQARFERPVNTADAALFAGKSVLMSMIKYDPLAWVRQWVEFHVRAHGIDAVLLYNNEAPDYGSEDILAALDGIEGLKTVGVVEWFFPYGPGAGSSGRWDSAFAQVGAMEHARWRFLQDAHLMLNADVDELLFCTDADARLTDLMARSTIGYAAFMARWATAERGAQHGRPVEDRHLRRSYYLNPSHTANSGKWLAVPAQLPRDAELGVHMIEGMESDPALSAALTLRHLPEFNAGWKGDRQIGANMTEADPIMCRTFERIGWT